MDRSLVLGIAFVVLVGVGAAVPPAGGAQAAGLGLQETVDPDLVNLNVAIQSNGTAEWEIEYFVRLSDENETRAFEDLQADVESNTSAYLDRFETRINGTVADAESSTGREMTATDYDVSAEIRSLGNRYGVISYTFTWTHFATVSGDQISAGDALEGLFLDEETTLQFSWSEDYQVASVTPDPTNERDRTVVWRGPLDFAAGEPSLTLEPASGTTTQGTTPATTPGDGPTTPAQEETSIWVWIVAGIVLLAIGAGAIWYLRGEPGAPAPVQETEDGDEPPAELLSNEERVEQFLESQGGRSKQQEIVDGLGWTEAKTSQVLSTMQESGRIEKFRIGRENVVKLPDTDGKNE